MFKVGDRVRVTEDDEDGELVGCVGTITDTDFFDARMWAVMLDELARRNDYGDGTWLFYADQLEAADLETEDGDGAQDGNNT